MNDTEGSRDVCITYGSQRRNVNEMGGKKKTGKNKKIRTQYEQQDRRVGRQGSS